MALLQGAISELKDHCKAKDKEHVLLVTDWLRGRGRAVYDNEEFCVTVPKQKEGMVG